jgi:large subunit ribosomal protein L13
MIQKTFLPKAKDIKTNYYLIDAQDKVLGRLATKVATLLRGKHKPIYTPHLDTGDFVIIINADKIRVTADKLVSKVYQRYSGYPAGKREIRLGDLLSKRPTEVLRLAITRMIPKGRLGYKVRKKLRIYAGDKHPHQAQKPVVLEL